MTARLSPAQQRVVDAMRDEGGLVWTDQECEWSTDAGYVHPNTAHSLIRRGIVELEGPPSCGDFIYRLAPAYGEAAR